MLRRLSLRMKDKGILHLLHSLPPTCPELAEAGMAARVYFMRFLCLFAQSLGVFLGGGGSCLRVPMMLTSGPGFHHPIPMFHFLSKHCHGLIYFPHISKATPNSGCGWHPNISCEWQEVGGSAQLSSVHVVSAE